MLIILLAVTLTSQSVNAGTVSLSVLNFTFDGAHQICSNEVVNFTCIGTNLIAQRWEWSRSINGSEEKTDITTLFRDSPLGSVTLSENIIESVLTVYLSEVRVDTAETSFANFSSSLQVNLSVLDNGNDVIICRGSRPTIRSSILVSYIPISIINMYYDDYAVASYSSIQVMFSARIGISYSVNDSFTK